MELLFSLLQTAEGDSAETEGKAQEEGTDEQIQDKPASADGSGSGAKTGPPETVFSKLMPSENRYTLLRYRDEL